MWGRHNVPKKPRTADCQDRDGHKSSDKDHDRNHNRDQERSKKPHRHSPQCKDHDGECTTNGKYERSCSHGSPSDSRKTKQRHRVSTSPSCDRKKSCTPSVGLCPLCPMFHSTPLATPHRLSSDPTSAHLSFDQSQSSLQPSWLGGRWTLSYFIRKRTNPGRHFISLRSQNLTICISLHLDSHCRSLQANLQSGLWRVTFEGVDCKGIRLASQPRGPVPHPGPIHRPWVTGQRTSRPFQSVLYHIVVWGGILRSKGQGYGRNH